MKLSAFATIPVKPQHFEEAKAAIVGIVEHTRAEEGCHAFELHEAPDGSRLHLYEVWADKAAFEAHHAKDYTRAIFRQYEDWLAEPVAITFMQPVNRS
ncbi:MAG: putative quinol monooxygenase [Erythrobacter sp.]|jgi:quinol monooxygenase YgiN|nr:putative quinol monooxygenase [Erythrobacter sp.]